MLNGSGLSAIAAPRERPRLYNTLLRGGRQRGEATEPEGKGNMNEHKVANGKGVEKRDRCVGSDPTRLAYLRWDPATLTVRGKFGRTPKCHTWMINPVQGFPLLHVIQLLF